MKNENLIQEAIRHLSKDERNEHIIDLLRRFLLSNQQQPSGKFNIYNYVLRDESRPVLQCVYHCRGVQGCNRCDHYSAHKAGLPKRN